MLVTETMAIAAAARSPRATCWGPSVHARGGLSLLGRCGYDEEQLGREVVGLSPRAGRGFQLQNIR